jgi:Sec-independent protein secretion pathway component TatC
MGGLNHIQLQVRDDIINVQNSYNVLATCWNLVYKYVIVLGHFFVPQKILYRSLILFFSLIFFYFWVTKCQRFVPKKKKTKETEKIAK